LHNSEDLNKINRALEDYAKKLLHKPIMNIKLEALNENKYTIIDAVKILFGLDYDKKIKIGTRGSSLALWQANTVKNAIQSKYPNIDVEIVKIKPWEDK